MQKYYVYVLRSQRDHKHYVGMTHNLKERLARHHQGREPSTKHRTPFHLIYAEEVDDRKSARVREKYWKSGAGREKIANMLPMADLPPGHPKADLPAGRRARQT